MEVKNLKIDSRLETNISDGSLKYVSSGKIPQTDRKLYSSNLELQSMGKLDTQVSRPCAIIGPDRILPPNSNEGYGKNGPENLWPCPDGYRQLYEHPLKMSEFQPSRNISPRQTFQENMQRIMVPPTYSSIKISDEPSSKNKLNVPPETKYCDMPYNINTLNNEHKTVRNVDIPVSNINPVFARNVPGNGWPGVSVRPLRPYPAPEFYQYSEYSNLAGPRQMPMVRPQRGMHDEPTHVYSDRLYQDANLRFKPYPTIKDRYPQTRYEYINGCGNPYPPPPSYPPHKFDIPKSLQSHPYPMYPQAPLKFVDRRLPESMIDGFQRPPNPHVNMNSFRNHIPPSYGSISGTCYQNKPYPYSTDNAKAGSLNKLPYDTNNRVYLDLDSRPKMYPPENLYYNDSQLIRGDIVIPGHPINSVPQHALYRKDNTFFKGYEYPSHYRNIDHPINPTSRLPLHFSPNAIAISPCDSNASNDTSQTMGALQEDCGYVSQSSTTSLKSFDNGMTNDMYKRHDYQNLSLQNQTHKSELNIKANVPNKKGLNVRQFLQMWNEGDEESDNKKEVTLQNNSEEQLYVLGLVNVPNEELCKYDHLQKLSKLPENIKGYNYIELLNQYERLVESPNFNIVHSKSKEHSITSKNITQTNKHILPRPLSPLDVEAKISQSVIHKEVGCNFEIKPCSPKLLNVDVATSVRNIIGERIIEKVTNPVLMNVTSMKETVENSVDPIPPSCNLSNKRYLDSMKSNNFNVQDLESNTSVCLASLPQLDNDIELNFAEVNQQFINATKTDTCVTKSIELQHHQHAQPQSEFLQNHEISVQTSNKESTKLSRYRKVKKNEVSIKESNTRLEDSEKADSPSTIQRIDSVIIKNPDNIKLQSTGCSLSHKNVSTLKNNSNEFTESLNYCFSSHSQHIDKSTYIEDLSAVSAIDFSLNKNENIPASDITTNNEYIDSNAELYNNKKKSDVRSNKLFENSMLTKSINEEFPATTNASNLFENKIKPHTTNSENIPNNKEKKNNSILLSDKNVNICDILNDDSLLNNSLSNNTVSENLSNNLSDHLLNVTTPVDKNDNFEESTVTLPRMEETVSVILNDTLFTNNSNKNSNEDLSNKMEDSACLEIKIEENCNIVEIDTNEKLDNDKMFKIGETIIVTEKSDKSSEFHETIFNSLQRKDESKPFTQDIVDFGEDLQENETVKDIFVFNDDEKLLVNNTEKESDIVDNDLYSCKNKIGNKEDCLIATVEKVEAEQMDNLLVENENDKSFQEKEYKYDLPERKDENNEYMLPKEQKEEKPSKEKEENKEDNSLTEKSNIIFEENNKLSMHDIKADVIPKENCINSRDFPLDDNDEKNALLYKNYNNEVLKPECDTRVKENSDNLTPNITEEKYNTKKHTSNIIDSVKLQFSNYEGQTDTHIDIPFKKTVNLGKELKTDDLKDNYIGQNNLQILQNDENSHPGNVSSAVVQNIEFNALKTTEKDLISIRNDHKHARISDIDTEMVNQKNDPLFPLTQITNINSPCEKSTDNCSQVNVKIKSKLNKTRIQQSKELFSPWIQKLLLHVEGVYLPTTRSDLVIKNNISSLSIKNENIVNNQITNNLKNIQEDINLNDLIHNEHKLDTQINLPSNMLKNEETAALETSKNYKTPVYSPDASIEIESLDNMDSKTLDNKLKINNSQCNANDSPPKHKEPLSSFDDSITMKRRSLKRSLSESAIGAYSKCDDTDTFFAKRSKLIQADLCSLFQTNRRNSIAEIYNEDSVYILIDDNNYVLTDENDTDKICYTDIVPISNNIDSNIETVHMVQANDLDGNCESCDSSSTLHNIEEKSFNETWVEDVGCMETIFNDDIAEDIIISAPGSPNSSVDSVCDTDDTLQCEEVIQHMEKVKDIYGGNMCNIDAQLVETLYRTPQMDVNKTLVNIESPVAEEIACDEVCLNRKFSTDKDMCEQHPNTEFTNSDCNISFSENSDKVISDKENIQAVTVAEVSSEDNTNSHVTLQQELDDRATYSQESSNHIKFCNNSNRSPKYCISSSSEVTSTTSEDRNSSILLKISNYNSSPISNINEEDTIINNKRTNYKLTEINHYKTFNTNYNTSGVLITKAAQKYIPPIKETISNLNLKVKLPLPQHSLNKLKQLKKSKVEPKIIKKLPISSNFNPSDLKTRHDLGKKQKPKFEDVLMNIDKIQLKKRKDAKKKDEIPKVVIKKNESGAHYASSSNVSKKNNYNPDLTGRKWQPWVFLEKNNFIDKMATKNKEKAIFCHRKNSYVLAEKFRKYKSIYNAKFVISQPKPTDVTKGNLKYTIRLKHFY